MIPARAALAALCLLIQAAPAAAAEPLVIRHEAAVHLVDVLAPLSPDLSRAAKIAISQDIHGAPLDGKPVIHSLRADSVRCRKRVIDGGAPAVCEIDFGRNRRRTVSGDTGEALFAAVRGAGVEDDAGMGHIAVALVRLACRIDDDLAQKTPATGDDVAGVTCRFELED